MDKAKKAIESVMSDTSVPAETTASRLKELRELIDTNLAALKDDGVDIDAA